MADDVKSVTPAPSATLYIGAGLHQFRSGKWHRCRRTIPTAW
jgi:hypothetical protein